MAADVARGYLTMRLSTPAAPAPTRAGVASTPPVERMALADYAIIAERNLFNANPPAANSAPVVEVKPVEETVQPTQLGLRLIGIASGASNQQYAIIEDLQRGDSQDLYQVGDVVQRAAIVDIRPECVLLDTRRQHEKLCFEYDSHTPDDANGRAAPSQRRETRNDDAPAGEAASDDVVRVDQGTWRVKRELITEQFADLGTLSRQVRVTPHSIQGRPSGFRLTRLRPGLLQRIGLVNGDVLQRVNGLDINSPEEALRAYQAVQSDSTVRLEILRRNSPTTLTYEIR